ncbi:MAG: uroporphyrinogen-III synthase [Acidobacteriaceae bacterium]
MSAAPLAGRRTVVTRAERQSGGLRERLEQQGAQVLLLPTIEIVPPESYAPLDDALRDAKRFAWLVVTSANAVRVIGERVDALGLAVQSLAHLRCAAVGASTAEALRELGLTVDVIPERHVGDALAAALTDRVRGQRLLLVRAAVARDVVPEALAAAGADLTIVDAYRTAVPAGAMERARAIFGGAPLPDAVVFTSGSTVAHLLDVLRDAGLVFPREVACVSIGPVTSAALRDAGLVVAAEADTASLDALVNACMRVFTS